MMMLLATSPSSNSLQSNTGVGEKNHYSLICFKRNEEPVQVCLSCWDVLFQVSSIPEGFTIDECATCLSRNGPFRIQPSQLAGHSAPCLFMLTCLLFSLLLLFLAPHSYSSTGLLYVPSICLRRLP